MLNISSEVDRLVDTQTGNSAKRLFVCLDPIQRCKQMCSIFQANGHRLLFGFVCLSTTLEVDVADMFVNMGSPEHRRSIEIDVPALGVAPDADLLAVLESIIRPYWEREI
jgi:hypothetical protein